MENLGIIHDYGRSKRRSRSRFLASYPVDIPANLSIYEKVLGILENYSVEVGIDPLVEEWYRGSKDYETTCIDSKYRANPDLYPDHPGYKHLWPFQRMAVSFITHRERSILSDQAGLGKTAVAVVATSLERLNKNRVLVLCPKSLKHWWAQEIDRWAGPEANYMILPTKERDRLLANWVRMNLCGYLIAHWELIRLMPQLAAIPWDFIIGDEAHKIKNSTTKLARAYAQLNYEKSMLLTATPMANNPGEIWNLMKEVDTSTPPKGMFMELYTFRSQSPKGYRRTSARVRNPDMLRDSLEGIMIRRLKTEVGIQIPRKRYQKVPLFLNEAQVHAYRQAVHDLLIQLEEEDEILRIPNTIAQIMRLRQIISGLATLPNGKDDSAKLDVAMDIIQGRDKDPIIVFTVFRKTAVALCNRLAKAKIRFEKMLWFMKPSALAQAVTDFQEGEIPVMVSTIGIGGVGHTLTAADTIIFIDKHYNPAMQEQAEDRIHRATQERPCLIISLHVNHTVDDLVEGILQRKRTMTAKVLKSSIQSHLEDSLEYI